jgi:hypothetical protein
MMFGLPIFDFRFLISQIAGRKSQIREWAHGLISLSSYKLMGLLCVLCLAFCSLLASAQEAEVGAKKVQIEVDSVEGGASSIEVMDTDDPNTEDRDVDPDRQNRNARERRSRRVRQGMSSNEAEDGQPGQRPGRLPPEARKVMREIMEKENISPQELRGNPDLIRELRGKVESVLRERELGQRDMGTRGQGDIPPVPDGDSAEGPQERRRRLAEGEPADKGLKRYMDAVVKNNLFLPLGSGGEEKKTSFALTAVVSGSGSRAIIEERGGRRSYYVSEGDTFADEVEVEDIDEQMVKLDRSGEKMELKLGEGTQSNRRRGRRGGTRGQGDREIRGQGEEDRRPRDDSGRRGQDNFDASQIPPPIRRILEERGISIDELQRNPELREELRREFEGRFRPGGGGRPPQDFRPEMRPRDGDRPPPDRARRMRR